MFVDAKGVNWQDRAHFFAVSAQMMRRILVDAARARGFHRRGGATPHVNLDDVPDVGTGRANELVALDDALNAKRTSIRARPKLSSSASSAD